MVWFAIVISFILDSIVSNFISLNSLFTPLFTLMSLILVYPYFKGMIEKYYITSFVTGICYDLIYTDTIIIHGFLFLFIAFIITRLNILLSNNFVNVIIMAFVCIITYRFITYGLLLITDNVSFHVSILFKSIYRSLILNLAYVSLGCIILERLAKKFKIRKIN
ncbi:MAG: rod shape-determining protein MreD [Bacilli bacterium]|nr:rod shape-determining protein MreD [Bacilli bacterium]